MAWDFKTNNPTLSQDFRDKYIINIKGKEYVTVNGLLALAHEKGMKGLTTKLIQFPNKDNDMTAIFEATVIGFAMNPITEKIEEALFTAVGDANSKSISTAMIAPHYIRMAETRAIGRVLRNYTNIGMVAIEELGSVIEVPKITAVQINKVSKLMKDKNVSKDDARDMLAKICNKMDLRESTPDEAEDLIKALEAL